MAESQPHSPADSGVEATLEANKKRIRSFYQALNARDVDAVLAHYGPDAEVEVFSPGPFSGAHRASRELLDGLFSAFPEI